MRKALIGAGIGLAAALFALLLGRLPFIDVVELKTYDWRMRATAGSARASDDIVLVTIDEESIRGLEPLVGRWPWPRLVHANVLNYLAGPSHASCSTTCCSPSPTGQSSSSQDEEWTRRGSRTNELATSARAVPLCCQATPSPKRSKAATRIARTCAAAGRRDGIGDAAEDRPVFVPPIAPVAAAGRAVAHNFAVLDPDGPWRRYVPFVRNQGRAIPSLAVATASVAIGIDQRQVRVDDRGLWVGSRLLPLPASAVRDRGFATHCQTLAD